MGQSSAPKAKEMEETILDREEEILHSVSREINLDNIQAFDDKELW